VVEGAALEILSVCFDDLLQTLYLSGVLRTLLKSAIFSNGFSNGFPLTI
jgi:hypothetical protein